MGWTVEKREKSIGYFSPRIFNHLAFSFGVTAWAWYDEQKDIKRRYCPFAIFCYREQNIYDITNIYNLTFVFLCFRFGVYWVED